MKCINCNIDNTLKDRRMGNMGRCKSCNHEFAFEPTLMTNTYRLTDTFFAQLVSDVSAKNTLFFTPSQVYYSLNQRLSSRFSSRNNSSNDDIGCFFSYLLLLIVYCLVALIIVRFFGESIPRQVHIMASIACTLFALWIWGEIKDALNNSILGKFIHSIDIGIWFNSISRNRNRHQRQIELNRLVVDRTQFNDWLDRWTSINNQSLILPPPQNFSLPATPNPEVTAYSFDRVVVCDTPEVAQLLISNNFHFENNCAILTIDGYPQNIFDTTMEMLLRNPDLKVYAFHNCSPNGIELPHRLRTEERWFPNLAIPIINVGILPRQIMDNFNLTILQSSESAEISQRLSPNIRASLTPAEIAWLDAGCYLELESLSPRKIIHILQRAISGSRELTAIEGDDMVITDRSSFYTVDSFG
jgi:hypothetical protein